LEKLLVEKEE